MATDPNDFRDNPIFRPIGDFATGPLTPSQQPSAKPTPTARKAPPAIRKMILELGFRYRPSQADDVKVHTAKLEVLASDLADVPAEPLQRAISQWIMSKPFMPKANELVDLAREYQPHRRASSTNLTLAQQYNLTLKRNDVRWVDTPDGGVRLMTLEAIEAELKRAEDIQAENRG